MVSSVNENVDYKLQLGCVDVDMVLNLFKIGDIIGKCWEGLGTDFLLAHIVTLILFSSYSGKSGNWYVV